MASSLLDTPPYTPIFPPPMEDVSLQQVENWAKQELDTIARLMTAQPGALYAKNNVAPIRPREGMLAFADGVNWNPGQGEGIYVFFNSSWHPIAVGIVTQPFAPMATATSGAFTTVSALGNYYQLGLGKLYFVRLSVTITAIGSAAQRMLVTLPASSTAFTHGSPGTISGWNSTSFKSVMGVCGFDHAAQVSTSLYDGSFPGTSGDTIHLSGWYEAA